MGCLCLPNSDRATQTFIQDGLYFSKQRIHGTAFVYVRIQIIIVDKQSHSLIKRAGFYQTLVHASSFIELMSSHKKSCGSQLLKETSRCTETVWYYEKNFMYHKARTM